MINFILPNFFENYYLNGFFSQITNTHLSYFKEPVSFSYQSGNYPYCSWNGGINNNHGMGAFYPDFIFYSCHMFLPYVFNFSNVLLEDYDKYDCMGNAISEVHNNGANLIEISDLRLMEYLKEKYPLYRYIFSKNAYLKNPMSAAELNVIIESGLFFLIGVPNIKTRDMEYLNELKSKRTLLVTVNPVCPLECKQYLECAVAEQKNQLNYSGNSIFNNCAKCQIASATPCLSLEDIKTQYLPLGIVNFTFEDFKVTQSPSERFAFLVQYFIKDEYQYEVSCMWQRYLAERGRQQ